MRKLLIGVALLMVIPTAASAGGGGHGSGLCAGFTSGTEVGMLDSCFQGTAHFAPVGEAITVVNYGELPHTFTAVDGSFDTGTLDSGETAEITVNEAGILQVYCSLHGTTDGGGMAGVLIAGEPEVTAIGVGLDSDITGGAMGSELETLAASVDNQSTMIAALTSSHSKLADTVGALAEDSLHPAWIVLFAAGAGALIATLVVHVTDRQRAIEEIGQEVGRVPLEA